MLSSCLMLIALDISILRGTIYNFSAPHLANIFQSATLLKFNLFFKKLKLNK